MSKKLYWQTCKNLVLLDLSIFRHSFLNKLINVAIWVILTIVVSGYILPFFGLNQNFGLFQLGGILAAVGLFELYSSAVDLVADYEGDLIINYNFTLPIPSYLALISKSVYYFIIYLILTIAILPFGKLCLWYQWDLTQVAWFKLALALIMQSIFYASFVILISSLIKNMQSLGSIWARFIFPMWFMGGFQFSWIALHQAMPIIAYINLINPMIYITESTRGAMLGQTGYLNFWLCILIILLASTICLIIGISRLKKRLDFV